MKALQLIAHGIPGKFIITDVPDPIPAPDEVVVKVKACGLNHLDLWLEEGALPIPVKLPRIPGSEVAGVVDRLGAKVTGWQIGDRVAIQPNLFCSECEFCATGDECQCLKGRLLGVDLDGGFAERVAVPASSLVSLPTNLDFNSAAALTLAGSTAMHMLTNRAHVRPGDWVLVMAGASGVGSAAIQIAKHLGARVISTGRSEAKREFALHQGAEFVVDPSSPNWTVEIRRITNKHGVDLIVEHVGGKVLEQLFHCLARNGTIVTCGATSGKDVQVNLWPFFVKQQRLIGSYGRNRVDLEAILELASFRGLKANVDKITNLADGLNIFDRLRHGEVFGKLIVGF